jgi:rod shape determining protein RodA
MMRTDIAGPGYSSRAQRTFTLTGRVLDALHLDGPLLLSVLAVGVVGLIVLFSAAGEDIHIFLGQAARLGLGLGVLLFVSQIPPRLMRIGAPVLYGVGVLLLVAVALVGDVAMGAQRWLDLGFIRFQPSEIMKIAVPLCCAWYLHERPLPPDFTTLVTVVVIVLMPTLLVAEQPDLGTALLIASGGGLVILLAGLQLRYILGLGAVLAAVVPIAWMFLLHGYQKQRVLTFLNPQNDPLGAGYHTIQSQIAIGSGGVFGKGYMNGSQAQLEFLPERSTDFIFAVIGEEWGLVGAFVLMMLYLLVIGRGLYIATQAQDTFSRLIAGSLTLTFSVYVFVNSGMVAGLLPVVGVPLPLVSYGGTSLVTLMAGFGILMSVHSRRKLVST